MKVDNLSLSSLLFVKRETTKLDKWNVFFYILFKDT